MKYYPIAVPQPTCPLSFLAFLVTFPWYLSTLLPWPHPANTFTCSCSLFFSSYILGFGPQPLCLYPLPGRDSIPHGFSCYLYTKRNQRILSFFISPDLSAPLPHPIEPLSFQPNLGIHLLILIPFSLSEHSNNALNISILISRLPLLIP